MADPEIVQLLEKLESLEQSIDARQALQNTSWNEVRASGVEVQEASTTTLPPNSRFSFTRNGNFLTSDEVDNQVTHVSPLYQLPIAADDTWVGGGADRNAYVPGFDTEVGMAFQTSAAPAEGEFLPSFLTLLEVGYACLNVGTVTGVPHEDFSYTKEGLVLHLEQTSADIRVYKDGSVADSLSRGDWKTDPFTASEYDWDPSKFALIRIRFDLYGRGDATFFLKLGNSDTNESDLVELGTVTVHDSPLLRVYNHRMQLRAEAASAVSGSPTVSHGPLEFHNRFGGRAPGRSKNVPYTEEAVNDSIGDTGWTVVRVYRMDMDRREAAAKASELHVEDSQSDIIAQVRAVHRDFLDFGGNDPDDDANWRAPGQSGQSLVRETSLEEFEVGSGTVTIDTFTDDDDETKVRGEQELVNAVTSGGGRRTTSRTVKGESPLNEFKYLVLLAQTSDTNDTIDLIEPGFRLRF